MGDVPPYSSDAVHKSIEKIAHNAIARYMYESNWYGNAERGFRNGAFDQTLPPVTGPTGTVEVVHRVTGGWGTAETPTPPPGAKFTGESHPPTAIVAYHYQVDPWEDIYLPWIQKIGSLFEGFKDLPDPADFEGPIASMQAAVGALTPLESAGTSEGDRDGDKFTSAGLASDLSTLSRWISPDTPGAWSGATIYAFDTAYGTERIKAVLHNQAQLAIMLGIVLQGEKNIWERARRDTMALMKDAEKAFDPTGSGIGINFDVVKALVDIVGEFIPPAYSKVWSVGSTALDLIGGMLPAKEADNVESKITGGTVEELYNSLWGEIVKLDTKIYEQENDLQTSLEKLLGEIASSPASNFHIHPDKGIEQGLEGGTLNVDPEIIGDIGYNVVPRIASTMARGAEKAQEADKYLIWYRTRVGMASQGPYQEWHQLLGQLDAVATGSARELTEAGRLLAVAGHGIKRVDEETKDATKGLKDELDRGEYGYDNSDADHVPPPPGGPSNY